MSDEMFILLLLLTSAIIYCAILAIPITVLWESVLYLCPHFFPIVTIVTIPILIVVMWRTGLRVVSWFIDKLGGKRLKRILEEDTIGKKIEKVQKKSGKKKKLNKKIVLLLYFVSFVVLAFYNFPYFVGILFLIPLHEFGHYIVAKFYHRSPRFVFTGNPGVSYKLGETKWSNIWITLSGFFFSMLMFPILFLLKIPVSTMYYLLLVCILCSCSDFYHAWLYWRKEK